MTRRLSRAAILLLAAIALAGCSSLPRIPAPDFGRWFDKSNKPGPLPALEASRTAHLDWQVSVGKSAPGLAPAVAGDAVYAAASDGTLVRLDGASGHVVWRSSAGQSLSAGPGADDALLAVGTDKGEILAFDTAAGKPRWTGHVSSEVVAPPRVAGKTVVAFAGDGRVFGLSSSDGKTVWVNQHANPSLIVRNDAGGVLSRGAVFFGTAGGRLLALDTETGVVGFDVAVATPKGATELERIADVTSLPWVDEHMVCAAAYQGRVACFDINRGNLLWSRDISSLAGLTGDDRNVYVTDDKGAVHALDGSNGASVWTQDVLKARRIGAPQLVGHDLLGVVDVEGWLHLLARSDGRYVGRLATDGSRPTSQPLRRGDALTWQSNGGNVYSVSVN